MIGIIVDAVIPAFGDEEAELQSARKCPATSGSDLSDPKTNIKCPVVSGVHNMIFVLIYMHFFHSPKETVMHKYIPLDKMNGTRT